jgi:hypothetical protein
MASIQNLARCRTALIQARIYHRASPRFNVTMKGWMFTVTLTELTKSPGFGIQPHIYERAIYLASGDASSETISGEQVILRLSLTDPDTRG